MKVVITSSFPVRDQNITSYYSFTKFSQDIEKTLVKQLEFLSQYDKFSLEMKITRR